jgi:steroid delta-isomerase-like uncharacterized protein
MGTRVPPARRLLELGCGPQPARGTCIGIDRDQDAARAAAATGIPCLAFAAPDLITNLAELPEPQHGRDAWRQGFEMMKHAFPDLQAHIEDVVAAEDKVAVRLRFRGTHRGEFLGIPATGRTIEYVSHEFYRIADGLIAEEWICSDMATLLRQLS